MLPVVLEGAQDSFWDGRRSGEMGTGGVEAVLISSVRERDLLTVRSAEGETTFSCYRETLGAGRARGAALVG